MRHHHLHHLLSSLPGGITPGMAFWAGTAFLVGCVLIKRLTRNGTLAVGAGVAAGIAVTVVAGRGGENLHAGLAYLCVGAGIVLCAVTTRRRPVMRSAMRPARESARQEA